MNLIEVMGYWGIGGMFALMEIALLWVFADHLGFKASLVAVFWVFGGAVPRYMLHKWWLHWRHEA